MYFCITFCQKYLDIKIPYVTHTTISRYRNLNVDNMKKVNVSDALDWDLIVSYNPFDVVRLTFIVILEDQVSKNFYHCKFRHSMLTLAGASFRAGFVKIGILSIRVE